MISMKTSQNKKQTTLLDGAVASDEPEYPYGLRISLDKDSLAKLGITELPEVGATMVLQARVEVVSVSQYDSSEGKSQDMSLQITDMSLDAEGSKHQMYPNSNMT